VLAPHQHADVRDGYQGDDRIERIPRAGPTREAERQRDDPVAARDEQTQDESDDDERESARAVADRA
jgi:hypothetical protein